MLYFIRPEKVKFICGFIYRKEAMFFSVLEEMQKSFGAIDFLSHIIPFEFTSYYEEEMGTPLFRRFVSFKEIRSAQTLVAIKKWCVKKERKYAHHQKRTVNIDPGYLTLAKLLLYTTKDYSHRIHIKDGVFAEITLIYKEREFKDLPWTFPDYRTEEYKQIFTKIREIFYSQLRIKGRKK